jgi:hypothetical protein
MRRNQNKRVIRVIAPTGQDRKDFILYQHKILREHQNKHYLPAEYFDQLIGLLEEIEEYEKCKEILGFKRLIYS